MEIQFLDNELEEFITSLQKPTIAKVLRTVDLLEKFGHQLGMPHSKKLANDLYELRVRGVQEVRIFYTFDTSRIILLYGFIKKSNKTPSKELVTAKEKLKMVK